MMTTSAQPKIKIATTSLAGCFGCHMSFLDMDERLVTLLADVEFNRSPLTDIKHCGACDIGLIEGGVCNAENVQVLQEFRANCKTLVAVGAWQWGLLPALASDAADPNARKGEDGHFALYLAAGAK